MLAITGFAVQEAVYGTLLAALGIEYEGQETLPVMLPE